MHRFVHVTFNFASNVKMKELEPVFTAIGDDWIRYSPLGWILWTAKPSPHIFTILSSHVSPQDFIFIASLPTRDVFGRLQPWMWDWMSSKTPDDPVQQGKSAEAMMELSADTLNRLRYDPK